LNNEIAQKTQQEVFAIARKTLADLASISIEEQSVNIFVKRMDELTKDEKKNFKDAFQSDSKPVLIQSTFELPHKQQLEIKRTVQEILGTKTHFEFKTAPELISGIELTANGYKLAWSISDYLNSMKKDISEIIKEKSKAASEAETQAEKKAEPKAKVDAEKKKEPEEELEPEEETKSEKTKKPKEKIKTEPEKKAEPKAKEKEKSKKEKEPEE